MDTSIAKEAVREYMENKQSPPLKEVTILCLGQTRKDCDYQGEIWGLNEQWYLPGKVDKIFIFDSEVFTPIYIAGMKRQKTRIVTREKIEGLDVEIYPLKGIVDRFGSTYFSCCMTYMIAYALYKDYNSIKMHGADMWTIEEFQKERPSMEYWLGRAHQMGVKVWINDGSALLKTYDNLLYGYEVSYDDFLKGHKREWPKKDPTAKWRLANVFPKRANGEFFQIYENGKSTGKMAKLGEVLFHSLCSAFPTRSIGGETICNENVITAFDLAKEIAKQENGDFIELDDRIYNWLLKVMKYKDIGISVYKEDIVMLTPLIENAEKLGWVKVNNNGNQPVSELPKTDLMQTPSITRLNK